MRIKSGEMACFTNTDDADLDEIIKYLKVMRIKGYNIVRIEGKEDITEIEKTEHMKKGDEEK